MCVFAVASVCGVGLAQVAAPPAPRPSAPPAIQSPTPSAAPKQPAQIQRVPTTTPDMPGTGEKVNLHPRWTKGDVAKYDFEFLSHWVSHMTDEEGGKKGGQLYRGDGRLVRRVLAVDDRGVVLLVMVERLHMQVSNGSVVTHYDSEFGDNPDRQNDLTGPVKATVGRPITIRLDNDGQVVGVEGNTDPDPDPSKPDAANPAPVLQAIVGTPVIRKLWKPLYGLDKRQLDARVGDKWTTEDVNSDPGMGTYGVSLHHELKEIKDGVARIETAADVDFTPAIGHSAVHATLTDSKVTGSVEWDTAKGTLKTWNTSQEMKLDLEKAGEKQKVETRMTTSFKLVDPNAPKDLLKDASKGGAQDVKSPGKPASPAPTVPAPQAKP